MQGEWLRRGQNLLITGPCGSGNVRWATRPVCKDVARATTGCASAAGADSGQGRRGSYARLLGQLAKVDLLILDDWGLETVNAQQRNGLLEVMDDRYGKYSTVVVSQLPTEEWHASLGGNTLADAILDRLMHNAHRLQLKGESMRKRRGLLTDAEQSS
ncbi:TPA: ATP-binding protein [Aeromonas salmonicida]|nr:ATP-binding protein [Aeromonas salmonicida]